MSVKISKNRGYEIRNECENIVDKSRSYSHNFFVFYRDRLHNQSGQLIVEILVAITVGGVLLMAATGAILVVIRQNYESRSTQIASVTAYDLINKTKSFAASDWHNIYNLAHSLSSPYYIISGATSSLAVSGQESVLSNDVAASLVGHWEFDETTGTIAYDSSENLNNGTLINGTTRAASLKCQIGNCLSFNGSNNYVSIASPPNPPSYVTVTAWFKKNGTPTGGYHIIFMQGTQIEISVPDPGGQIRTGVTTQTLGRQVFNSGSGVTDGNWHFLSLTYDGSNLISYIDGKQTATNPVTGALSTGSAANIGYYPGYYTNGSIDDVRIYSRALSANEISQLYNSSVYTRCFYLSNVSRDTNGNIVNNGGTDDPSTQLVTAVITRSGGTAIQFNEYLTRSKNAVFTQSSWSGGSNQDGPITIPTNTFSTSTNITAGTSIVLATTTSSGNLTSSIVDTQSVLGATINAIVWQGTTNGGTVQFQLAYSNNLSGPWNYGGSAGGGSYYNGGSNVSIAVTNVNNYRYVRYKIFLNPSGNNSPSVTGVMLNWSP